MTYTLYNYSFQAVRLHQSFLTLYLAKLGEQRQYRKERGFTSSTLANYAVENNNDKKNKQTALKMYGLCAKQISTGVR